MDPRDFEEFASQASRHLQNTWFLFRARGVASAGQGINQGRFESPRLLFEGLAPRLVEFIDSSHLSLLALKHWKQDRIDLYVHFQGKTEEICNLPLDGGWRWLLAHGSSVLIRRFSAEQGEYPVDLDSLPGVPVIEPRPESLLFAPLLVEGKPIGLFGVLQPSRRAFEDEDRHILELLANHVALAVNNHRLFSDLRRLNEAGQILIKNLDSDQVLPRVAEIIRTTAGADLVLLYPYLRANDSFDLPPRQSGKFLSRASPLHARFLRPDDIAALAIRRAKPVFAADSRKLYSLLGGNPSVRRGNFEEREEIRSVAAMPLLVGDEEAGVAEPVGVLFVNFRSPQDFDEPQQEMLGGLASYAAIAIKNARQFGALSRRHIEELETLQAIERDLGRFESLAELLRKILEQTQSRVRNAECAAVLLYDPERRELAVRAVIGNQQSRLGSVLPVPGRGISVRAFEERRSVLAADVHDPDWRDVFFDTGDGTRAELDVPLLEGDVVLGVLNLESTQPQAFTAQDARLLATLAGPAALAVRQAQALEAQKRLATSALEGQKRLIHERRALIELGQEITQRLDVEGLLELIVDQAMASTRADVADLVLLDASGKILVIKAKRGHNSVVSKPISIDAGVVGLVARQGKGLNVADVTQPPWPQIHIAVATDMRSELAVPLFAGSELKGVLNVESRAVGHFDEGAERMIEALADFAVIALQNAKRYGRAEKRRLKLEALHAAGQEIVQQPNDPNLVLRAIIEHAKKLTGAVRADLDVYENGRLTACYQIRAGSAGSAGSDRSDDSEASRRLDLAETLATAESLSGIRQYVAKTRTAYRTRGDTTTDPIFAAGETTGSGLGVPLVKGSGELIGVLYVEATVADAFDDDDQEALELYASQAVVAIDNTRNFAQAQRERQRFELLLRASRELEKIVDLDQLDWAYQTVFRIAESQYRESQVVLRRFDPERQILVRKLSALASPAPFEHITLDDPLNGWVARNHQPIVVADADVPTKAIGHFERSNPRDRAFVVVPIKSERSYYGNLALSHEQPYYFQHDDLELLGGLVEQLAFTHDRLADQRAHRETERRAKETEVMGRVGRQAFEIIHRLSNQLGLVRTYINNIRAALPATGAASNQVESFLGRIEEKTQWVVKATQRLRKELGRSGDPELLSVQAVIEEALRAVPLDEREFIGLDCVLAPDLAPVFGVQAELLDALVNILTNAIEAMPEGGLLSIRASNAGGRIRIAVGDTGSGLTEEEKREIFGLFYSKKGAGRGFGLWSVQNNIVANGGTLMVESKPGAGSTFTVELPRAPREADV